MEGTALRNWRAFEKICGEGFNKVVLTTTVWNDVDDEVGDGNAQELEDLWRTRAVCGWSMKNFTRDRPSAANVLSPILEDVTKGALRMQREVIDFNMSLKQTTAARILYLELQDLQRQCKRNLIMIRDGLKNPSLSKQELNNLEAEYKKTSFLLVRVTSGLADLESTPSERLQRLKLMTKFIMMTRFPSALGLVRRLCSLEGLLTEFVFQTSREYHAQLAEVPVSNGCKRGWRDLRDSEEPKTAKKRCDYRRGWNTMGGFGRRGRNGTNSTTPSFRPCGVG